MKTFDDLEFNRHANLIGIQAVIKFDNDYGLSVVQVNDDFRDSSYGKYDLLILRNSSADYGNPISDGEIIKQNPPQVTEIMKKIQKLGRFKDGK